jgi:hypothetical protein
MKNAKNALYLPGKLYNKITINKIFFIT